MQRPGPLLFLIYNTDLPLNLPSHIRPFADDCVEYRGTTNPDDQSLLQQNLNIIFLWGPAGQLNIIHIKLNMYLMPADHLYH